MLGDCCAISPMTWEGLVLFDIPGFVSTIPADMCFVYIVSDDEMSILESG